MLKFKNSKREGKTLNDPLYEHAIVALFYHGANHRYLRQTTLFNMKKKILKFSFNITSQPVRDDDIDLTNKLRRKREAVGYTDIRPHHYN
jgi:hypothetical protein